MERIQLLEDDSAPARILAEWGGVIEDEIYKSTPSSERNSGTVFTATVDPEGIPVVRVWWRAPCEPREDRANLAKLFLTPGLRGCLLELQGFEGTTFNVLSTEGLRTILSLWLTQETNLKWLRSVRK